MIHWYPHSFVNRFRWYHDKMLSFSIVDGRRRKNPVDIHQNHGECRLSIWNYSSKLILIGRKLQEQLGNIYPCSSWISLSDDVQNVEKQFFIRSLFRVDLGRQRDAFELMITKNSSKHVIFILLQLLVQWHSELSQFCEENTTIWFDHDFSLFSH